MRSDRDEQAIEIFKRLGETVEAIPPSLVTSAEQLRGVAPDLFERRLARRMKAIGSTFSPATAAEFLARVLER